MKRSTYILFLLLIFTLVFPLSVFADPDQLMEIRTVDQSSFEQPSPSISNPQGYMIIIGDSYTIETQTELPPTDIPDGQTEKKPPTSKKSTSKDKNESKDSNISDHKVSAMVKKAKSRVETGTEWDCSEFVQQMYKSYLKISLPRITDAQYYDRLVLSDDKIDKLPTSAAKKLAMSESEFNKLKAGSIYAKRVARDDLQPGDLIFQQNTYKDKEGCKACIVDKRVTHVSLYVGHNTFVSGSLGSNWIHQGTVSDISQWFAAKRYFIKR